MIEAIVDRRRLALRRGVVDELCVEETLNNGYRRFGAYDKILADLNLAMQQISCLDNGAISLVNLRKRDLWTDSVRAQTLGDSARWLELIGRSDLGWFAIDAGSAEECVIAAIFSGLGAIDEIAFSNDEVLLDEDLTELFDSARSIWGTHAGGAVRYFGGAADALRREIEIRRSYVSGYVFTPHDCMFPHSAK